MSARVGLVFACGGLVGYAWSLLALQRYARATGFDPPRAAVLVGTSAGSILATELGAGRAVDDLVTELVRETPAREALPPWPRLGWPSAGLLARGLVGGVSPRVALSGLIPEGRGDSGDIAARVDRLVPKGAWVDHPACLVVGLDAETGARVAFGRPPAPSTSSSLAVRASCAIPGWYAPVEIDGRRYLDGGVASPTSADLLMDEDLDEIVIFSPMTSARAAPARSIPEGLERVMRRSMTAILDREVRALEGRGHRVTRFEPTLHELGSMGGNFMDGRRRREIVAEWTARG